MSKCVKCNVIIKDDSERCPLCQHVLTRDVEPEENVYPDAIHVTKKFRFWENLFLFLSLVLSAGVIVCNQWLYPTVSWGLVVILILVYANAVIRLAITGRSGYLFKTFSLLILAVFFLLGIDYLTGYHKWSLDYVLPACLILADITILILMLVNRRNWQSYMMTEILVMLLSLIPVILWLFEVIVFPYLVWVAVAASVFLFLGTLILGDRRARTELRRRFYV